MTQVDAHASDIFKKNFWTDIFISLLRPNNINLDNYFDEIYSDCAEMIGTDNINAYNVIWNKLLSRRDKLGLFNNNNNEFYFWVHNLTDEYYEYYIYNMEKGKELTDIINHDIGRMKQRSSHLLYDLWTKHSQDSKLVSLCQTDNFLILSSMNKKALETARKNMILSGYIIYHNRKKTLNGKTLYSCVYDILDNNLQQICLS